MINRLKNPSTEIKYENYELSNGAVVMILEQLKPYCEDYY